MRITTIIDVKSARKESRYFFWGGLAFQLFRSNFLAFCWLSCLLAVVVLVVLSCFLRPSVVACVRSLVFSSLIASFIYLLY